jgi:hypothetical protein
MDGGRFGVQVFKITITTIAYYGPLFIWVLQADRCEDPVVNQG